MAAFSKLIRRYHPPFVWNANGLLGLYPLAPAATALAPAYIVDGTRELPVGLLVDVFVLHLVFDGTANTTTWEVWRRRAGVDTLLATLSIAAATTNYSRVAVQPASTALRTLNVLDRLYVQPTAAAANASDATIEGQFT